MDFLSFFIGLWVGGLIGVGVMALLRSTHDSGGRRTGAGHSGFGGPDDRP